MVSQLNKSRRKWEENVLIIRFPLQFHISACTAVFFVLDIGASMFLAHSLSWEPCGGLASVFLYLLNPLQPNSPRRRSCATMHCQRTLLCSAYKCCTTYLQAPPMSVQALHGALQFNATATAVRLGLMTECSAMQF